MALSEWIVYSNLDGNQLPTLASNIDKLCRSVSVVLHVYIMDIVYIASKHFLSTSPAVIP